MKSFTAEAAVVAGRADRETERARTTPYSISAPSALSAVNPFSSAPFASFAVSLPFSSAVTAVNAVSLGGDQVASTCRISSA